MYRMALTLTLALTLMHGPADAGLLIQNVRLDLHAGAFCTFPDNGKFPAPETRSGFVGIDARPYQFVEESDSIPALPDMGIGLVVRLIDPVQFETLTLTTELQVVGSKPDRWPVNPFGDGYFWFSTVPQSGDILLPGRYKFRAYRGTALLLEYDFRVHSPSKAERDRLGCTPTIS